jgi:hypothetical protein
MTQSVPLTEIELKFKDMEARKKYILANLNNDDLLSFKKEIELELLITTSSKEIEDRYKDRALYAMGSIEGYINDLRKEKWKQIDSLNDQITALGMNRDKIMSDMRDKVIKDQCGEVINTKSKKIKEEDLETESDESESEEIIPVQKKRAKKTAPKNKKKKQ